MKNLSLIACVSSDLGLGYNNDLLWRFPADQQFFRKTTIGHPVIMGRHTFESIGRPLPDRENIVLSRSQINDPAVKTFSNFETLNQYLKSLAGEKFVIGGASIFAQYLPLADKIYLTEVASRRPADVFFPEFDKTKYSREVLAQASQDGVNFAMVLYRRLPQEAAG